jgi:hypothetical protein
MTMRVPLKHWVQAIAYYVWMWLKALPLLYVPFFSRTVTDTDAFEREMKNDVATLKRLLKRKD